jgi:hypothetical protein
MSKPIDFAKRRRAEGRSLRRATRELNEIIARVAPQQGIDLKTMVHTTLEQRSEAKRLLAERLQESVVPLFVSNHSGPPDRIGSCVLVRVDSELYAFTAAHVIQEVGSAILLAPSDPKGGTFLPLPQCTARLKSGGLDAAVLALPTRQLGPFQRHTFLAGNEIDFEDQPDAHDIESFYFVLGYSASKTQVKVERDERRIHQQSFSCSTDPVAAAEYIQERISKSDHILLDFDHKEMSVQGRRRSPPKLQGVSGGGIFHIARKGMRGPLVAIATENRRRSRLIVGTRIKHFLAIVRELKNDILV